MFLVGRARSSSGMELASRGRRALAEHAVDEFPSTMVTPPDRRRKRVEGWRVLSVLVDRHLLLQLCLPPVHILAGAGAQLVGAQRSGRPVVVATALADAQKV